jgi:hypothetical protein
VRSGELKCCADFRGKGRLWSGKSRKLNRRRPTGTLWPWQLGPSTHVEVAVEPTTATGYALHKRNSPRIACGKAAMQALQGWWATLPGGTSASRARDSRLRRCSCCLPCLEIRAGMCLNTLNVATRICQNLTSWSSASLLVVSVSRTSPMTRIEAEHY